jgi:hypothetical protein
MGKFTSALVLAGSALPMIPASAADTLAAGLQPFAFLAGSCWRAAFPGGQMTDTHCFTPILNGHFLRDRHIVSHAPDPYLGETIYRWDAAAGRIHYDYYASDGSHSAGTAQAAANGLSFLDEQHDAAGGNAMQIRSTWTREGADTYVALAEARNGDSWRELFRLRFTRIAQSPAE